MRTFLTLPCLCPAVHECQSSLRLRGTTFKTFRTSHPRWQTPPSGTLSLTPKPNPGVNQAGRRTTADLVVLGVSQDGAGALGAGRPTFLARPAGPLAVPRPVAVGWHWHHAGRLAWLSLSTCFCLGFCARFDATTWCATARPGVVEVPLRWRGCPSEAHCTIFRPRGDG